MPEPERTRRIPGLQRTSLRLSLQYSFLYSVLVIIVFVVAYVFTLHEIKDWAQDWMRDDAAALAQLLDSQGPEAVEEAIDRLAQMDADETRAYGLFSAEGAPRAGTLSQLPAAQTRFASREALGLAPHPEGEVSGYWLRIERLGPYWLVQGTSDHLVYELVEALGVSLILGFLALAILGIVLGRRIGRLTEDRVEGISGVLEAAGSGDLRSRIADPGPQDDLGVVERKINDTLDRLQRLVDTQQQISVDIAHDLRTPLQHLRHRLEALSADPQFDEGRAGAIAVLDGIVETFQSLLDIAALGTDSFAMKEAPVSVASLFDTLAELYADEARAASIRLNVARPTPDVQVLGDAGLLTRMMANLIENALKYCPPGSTVALSCAATGRAVSLRVTDDGPGVPAAEAERIFDRFVRLETSRGIVVGNGLGLALVKAIAAAHGATALVVPSDTGLAIEIRDLVRAAPVPPAPDAAPQT